MAVNILVSISRKQSRDQIWKITVKFEKTTPKKIYEIWLNVGEHE